METNFDLDNTVTPVNVDQLEGLLRFYKYDSKETSFIVDGFTHGFEIGYRCSCKVKQNSNNLRLDCGSPEDLWGKMMKEVKLKQFAGPFKKLPFDNYIQSPVGLVPKVVEKKTQGSYFICLTPGEVTQSIHTHPKSYVQFTTII